MFIKIPVKVTNHNIELDSKFILVLGRNLMIFVLFYFIKINTFYLFC